MQSPEKTADTTTMPSCSTTIEAEQLETPEGTTKSNVNVASSKLVFCGCAFPIGQGPYMMDLYNAFNDYIQHNHSFEKGIELLHVMALQSATEPKLVAGCELLANDLWRSSSARAQNASDPAGEDERLLVAKIMANEVADEEVHTIWKEVLEVENIDMLNLASRNKAKYGDEALIHLDEILSPAFRDAYHEYKHQQQEAHEQNNALAYVLVNH